MSKTKVYPVDNLCHIKGNVISDSRGTYTCTFDVSQGNQINMAIPHNPKKSKGSEKVNSNKPDMTPEAQIFYQMVSDLDLDATAFENLLAGTEVKNQDGVITKLTTGWSKDWFNFNPNRHNSRYFDCICDWSLQLPRQIIYQLVDIPTDGDP